MYAVSEKQVYLLPQNNSTLAVVVNAIIHEMSVCYSRFPKIY